MDFWGIYEVCQKMKLPPAPALERWWQWESGSGSKCGENSTKTGGTGVFFFGISTFLFGFELTSISTFLVNLIKLVAIQSRSLIRWNWTELTTGALKKILEIILLEGEYFYICRSICVKLRLWKNLLHFTKIHRANIDLMWFIRTDLLMWFVPFDLNHILKKTSNRGFHFYIS